MSKTARQLNGWQRLYVLLALIIVLATFGLLASSWPTRPPLGQETTYACELREPIVSPDRARNILRMGHVPARETYAYPPSDMPLDAACATDLQLIANGQLHGRQVAEFWDSALRAALILTILLGGIYATGAAVGWVWRGFVPRRELP